MESKVISHNDYIRNNNLSNEQLIETLYEEKSNLIKQLEEYGVKYEFLDKKYEDIQHQIDLLKIDKAELEQLVSEQKTLLEENEKKHKDLSEKVNKQNVEIVGLKKDNVKIAKECTDIKKNNVKLTIECSNLKKDNVKLTKECKENNIKIVDLTIEITALKKENIEFKEDNKELRKDITALQYDKHNKELAIIAGETITAYLNMITYKIMGRRTNKKFKDIMYGDIDLTITQQSIYDAIIKKFPMKEEEFMETLDTIKQTRNDDCHDANPSLTIYEIKKSTHEYIDIRHNKNKELYDVIDFMIDELKLEYGNKPLLKKK